MPTFETTIDTGTDELLCGIADGVGTMTLNRPDTRNAMSTPMSLALRKMLKQWNDDSSVRVILLTGAGNSFCAGGDVKNMGDRRPPVALEEQLQELKARHHGVGGQLVTSPKPTIAAISGPAVGAGLAIALACDLRIAGETAFFSSAYAKIGLSGDYGIAWLLTRTVGAARARAIRVTSERIGAARAETIGLVNRVVPDAELAAAARALAIQIADVPADAIHAIKQNLDEASSIDHSTAIDREAERIARLMSSDNHKEAVRAFVEKRKPVFNRS